MPETLNDNDKYKLIFQGIGKEGLSFAERVELRTWLAEFAERAGVDTSW